MTQTLVETEKDNDSNLNDGVDDFPIRSVIVRSWTKKPDSVLMCEKNDIEIQTVFHDAVIFNNDLAAVRVDNGWYIIDQKYEESLNNAPFYCDEIDLMILTFVHIAEAGRTEDDIFGPREFLAATVKASDDVREKNSGKLDSDKLKIIQDFGDQLLKIVDRQNIHTINNNKDDGTIKEENDKDSWTVVEGSLHVQ